MKATTVSSLVVVSLTFTMKLLGQGFVNLDFEDTTITPVGSPASTSYVATVPGWTWSPPGIFAYYYADCVAYNDIALDSPQVTLHSVDDPFGYPAIDGNYSILLQGGSQFVSSTSYSAIWQTGQIPATAESLIYWGGALQVTFDGQSLTPIAIGNAANYTVWAMDISAYAGQTGELRFTKPWLDTNFSDGALLDNIQFSPVPVPEPSTLALFGVCLFFLSGTRLMQRPTILWSHPPLMLSAPLSRFTSESVAARLTVGR
jgi:hypothetical protein